MKEKGENRCKQFAHTVRSMLPRITLFDMCLPFKYLNQVYKYIQVNKKLKNLIWEPMNSVIRKDWHLIALLNKKRSLVTSLQIGNYQSLI